MERANGWLLDGNCYASGWRWCGCWWLERNEKFIVAIIIIIIIIIVPGDKWVDDGAKWGTLRGDETSDGLSKRGSEEVKKMFKIRLLLLLLGVGWFVSQTIV